MTDKNAGTANTSSSVAGLQQKVADLEQTLARQNLFFDFSIDMLAVAGFDGFFKQVNAAFTRTLGWSESEMVSKAWIDFVHPDDHDATIKAGQQLLNGNPLQNFENKYLCKDGSYRTISWNSFPIPSQQLSIAVARDVSMRKKTQEALKASEERYRSLFEFANDAIFVLENGTFIDCNDKAADLLGYPRDHILGKCPEDFSPSQQPDGVGSGDKAARILSAVSDGNPQVFEWQHTYSDGSLFDTEVSIKSIAIDEKLRSLAIVRDISEHKMIVQALRKERDFTAAIFNTVESLVVVLDTAGRIVMFNHACEKCTGYSFSEIKGKLIWDFLLIPEECGRVEKIFLELTAGASANRCENNWLTKDGQRRLIDWSNTMLTTADGTIEYIIATGIDITESVKLKTQLQQSQKMEAVGRMAGGIAHDFNNILTTIIGGADLLLESMHDDGEDTDIVRDIRKAGFRASNLTRQLLAFSRKQVFEARIISIDSIIQNISSLLSRLVREDINLVIQPAADGSINADATQIEQVIINLVINARDAMPHGGSVLIETQAVILDDTYCKSYADLSPGKYILLSVSDTGCGMEKRIIDNIFEPFFTTKDPGKGTGLGLSMVYGIVKQHHGHIIVYSEPGLGTTFKIYFPRATRTTQSSNDSALPASAHSGSETILVVEDEDIVRNIIVKVLSDKGYSVLNSGNVYEALELAGTHKDSLSLLISDVIMPGMNGRELYDRIIDICPALSVIFISGYTDNIIAHDGFLDRNFNFLQKPFSMDDLAKKIRAILDKP